MFSLGAVQILASITVTVLLTNAARVKLNFEVDVQRNGGPIKWDKKLSNTKSKEFKVFTELVKRQMKKDLSSKQNKVDIEIQRCREGSTLCEVEWKVDSKINISAWYTEEELNNRTVDIGAENNSWATIDMRLQIVGIGWLVEYSDPNSSEHRNLTSDTENFLIQVYQNTTEIYGFEIVAFSERADHSVVVDYTVLIDSDSDLNKSDLEEILTMSTTSGEFRGMTFTKVENQKQKFNSTAEESGASGVVVGLVVFAAIIMSVGIVAFIGHVLFTNWKYARRHTPGAQYESYQSRKVSGVYLGRGD